MDWYVVRAHRDEEVAADLTAAGLSVFRPVYRLEYFDRRRSRHAVRELPLLPGYLLVNSAGSVQQYTRHRVSGLGDAPAHRADEFVLRCQRGEFDVLRSRPTPLEEGTRVLVLALGVVGEIVSRLPRFDYLVRPDGWVGRDLRVARVALELV